MMAMVYFTNGCKAKVELDEVVFTDGRMDPRALDYLKNKQNVIRWECVSYIRRIDEKEGEE